MNEQPTLLPCPFCGGTKESGILAFSHGTKYVYHEDREICRCFDGVLISVAQWNRSAPATPSHATDTAGLVGWRHKHTGGLVTPDCGPVDEADWEPVYAADALSALRAENERLARQVGTLKEGWRIADEGRIEAEAERDRLQAELAEAQDLLNDCRQRLVYDADAFMGQGRATRAVLCDVLVSRIDAALTTERTGETG